MRRTFLPDELLPNGVRSRELLPDGGYIDRLTNGGSVRVPGTSSVLVADHRSRRGLAAAFVLWPLTAGILAATILNGWTPTTMQALALLGATFGASRCAAKEKVGGPLRDALSRSALSELVGCPRCLGVWVALALVTLVATTPSAWPVVWVLALAGANFTWQDAHGRIDG